jgi:PPM family protein phosphatase
VSLRVSCPSCSQPCQVADEHLGKAIRCPGCKQPFTARRPAPPPPPLPPLLPAVPSSSPELPPLVFPEPARPGRLAIGSATSPGRLRERNEDSLLVQQLHWSGQAGAYEAVLAVVADGMGGHDAGDRASAVAIAAVAAALLPRLGGLVGGQEPFEDGESILDALDHALWEANRAVSAAAEQEAGCAGMGSTAVAALVIDGTAAVCHVGDCRAYLCRDGKLELKTRDQTVVSRMVDLGMLSEKEAKAHSAAGQVTQALGRQYELEPSRLLIELRAGDRLVLACDGLHAHLGMEELGDLISAQSEAADLAAVLVRRADDAGGSDNCTVIVIDAW